MGQRRVYGRRAMSRERRVLHRWTSAVGRHTGGYCRRCVDGGVRLRRAGHGRDGDGPRHSLRGGQGLGLSDFRAYLCPHLWPYSLRHFRA